MVGDDFDNDYWGVIKVGWYVCCVVREGYILEYEDVVNFVMY